MNPIIQSHNWKPSKPLTRLEKARLHEGYVKACLALEMDYKEEKHKTVKLPNVLIRVENLRNPYTRKCVSIIPATQKVIRLLRKGKR